MSFPSSSTCSILALPRAHRVTGALVVMLCLCLLVACTPSPPAPPVGSCTLDLPAAAQPEDAVRAVVWAEGEFVVAQNIEALMALWADGAYVANAKNTPDQPDDDQFWRDKDAIRHRYVRTVFPGAPTAVTPADLQVTIDGRPRRTAQHDPHRRRSLPRRRPLGAGQTGRLLGDREPDL